MRCAPKFWNTYHAFYLVATQLGGHAWEKAGRYGTIHSARQGPNHGNFQNAANITSQVARDSLALEAQSRKRSLMAGRSGHQG